MRIALLADIHGNLAALDAVLADADAHGAETIIVAGDHLAGGPRPVEVFGLLQSRGAILIRGNNDGDLVDARRGRAPIWWRTGVHYGLLRWSAEMLTEQVVAAVEALPEQRVVAFGEAPPIRVVHGSPRNVREPVMPIHGELVAEVARITGLPSTNWVPRPLSEVLADVTEPVMVCGHTHLAWQARRNGQLVVNPGSVGVPTNRTAHTEYALLTLHEGQWCAKLRSIAYDLDRVRADYRETGLDEAAGPLGRAFMQHALTGKCLCLMFCRHVRSIARLRGLDDGGWLPDEIWYEAEATFDRASALVQYTAAFERLVTALTEAGQGVT